MMGDDLADKIYMAIHPDQEFWGGCHDRELVDRIFAVALEAEADAWDEAALEWASSEVTGERPTNPYR